jgi:hypothetical protein
MSRYASDLRTTLGRDEAWRVICDYLRSQGFEQKEERGETVWRKGMGLATIPQFVRAVTADGSVHIEAWVSAVAIVPGVYTGEQDLSGFWGWAIKSALKDRVRKLEALLGDQVVSRVSVPSPVQGAPAAAIPPPPGAPAAPAASQAPAAWSADPAGRHELRYWDGSTWTDHVSDGGETSEDPY